ncbi:hypothetical protein DSM19430T_19410 [Desulfovibrio psychrotolerans]|uniref:Lipoprotein n=1 Tax=Desulfovibrio psychrotolerans TaxID=415242 RepID=A0A7J0BU64_9BACT|nr:hypothetical protein DSM19430T_19410 [Desulfovibrio psychrotolerans]
MLALALCAWAGTAGAFGPADCPWVAADMSFRGAAVEQGQCLLTPQGSSAGSHSLPSTFDALLGTEFGIPAEALERFFFSRRITDEAVGGPLRLRVSLSGGEAARYFVLHGVLRHGTAGSIAGIEGAGPCLAGKPAPVSPPAEGKEGHAAVRPGATAPRPVISGAVPLPLPCWHVAVWPNGRSVTLVDFFTPLRATRFELEYAGARAKGRFLHVLVLPQQGEAGVTEAQYARLAHIYMAASQRAGTWLVPAYAGVLDSGIDPGAHSPAGFDVQRWAHAVREAYRGALAVR